MSGSGYLERVVLREETGPVSRLIRALLWPLSLLYRAGLAVYLAVYRVGLRKRHRLRVPVISVGNLTFGGTGKTPAVQEICRMLLEQGRKVAILSRGHGGTARGCVVVSDGDSVLVGSDVAGDEPVLLAESLPGVPVVVGKDRRAGGELACREFAPDVIVLDDGLQYWQLHRDLDVVVLDARRLFGSGWVMPMGDLREPVGGLRRAGAVLLTHAAGLGEPEYEALLKRVAGLAPGVPVFRCSHVPDGFRRAGSEEKLDLSWVRGRRVVAFCGIGRPQSFFEMLESLGADLAGRIVFPDHHRYTDRDVGKIGDERVSTGAEAVVTTEKDIARLGQSVRIAGLHAFGIKLEIGERSRLAEYISNRVNSTDRSAASEEAAY